jgi:hypothetical protein
MRLATTIYSLSFVDEDIAQPYQRTAGYGLDSGSGKIAETIQCFADYLHSYMRHLKTASAFSSSFILTLLALHPIGQNARPHASHFTVTNSTRPKPEHQSSPRCASLDDTQGLRS